MMLRFIRDRNFFLAVLAAAGLAAGWALADIVIDGNRASPEISITSPCEALAVHTPQDDVAYRPTEGTRSADLGDPSPITVPETIDIPLTVDFARRLGLAPEQGVQLEGTLGFIQVRKDGTTTYDGKDITREIIAACGGDALAPVSKHNEPKDPPNDPSAEKQ